jgi:cysteine-rich repeat protein
VPFCLGVLLVALPSPARALICGDGILDTLLFEECDDGNNLGGDCCSPFCQLVEAGTECRAAADACDVAEVCDGVSGFCPADVRLPDTDADGVCDELDHCPAIADPENADTDGDGLGDACDPCTNPARNPILKAKLSFSKLGPPMGDDSMRLKGGAVVPNDPPLNPMLRGMRILVEDGDGMHAIDATIPPGPFDPSKRAGWKVNPQGTVFSYRARDGAAEANGIQRVVLKQKPSFLPGNRAVVRFVIVGRGGTYPGPQEAPVTVTLSLAPPHAANGQCAEGQFNANEDGGPRCVYLNNGQRFVCR